MQRARPVLSWLGASLKPGQRVRHYKGGVYRMSGVAFLTQDSQGDALKELALYRPEAGGSSPEQEVGPLFARPVDEFFQRFRIGGRVVCRFELLPAVHEDAGAALELEPCDHAGHA